MNRFVAKLPIVMILLPIATIALGQGSYATVPLNAEERDALFPSSAQIAQGKLLAEATCAGCHGLDGFSVDPGRPHLAGQRTIYLYRELLAYKNQDRNDESMHRTVGFLGNAALLNVAIYYASLPPPSDHDDAAMDEDTAGTAEYSSVKAGEAATAGCSGCHGKTGNSKLPGSPNLTAQHPEYFLAAIAAYRDDRRRHAMMQQLVASLDQQTIQNMANYYALQVPDRAATQIIGDAGAGRTAAAACAGCHGVDGNATAFDTPTLAGQEARYLSMATMAYQNGQREHAAMAIAVTGLGNSDIENLSAFYAEQLPVQRPVIRPPTSAEWVERCNRCHGINGNSNDPRYASLAGQNEQYLFRVMTAYAEETRSNTMMHAMIDPLGEANIRWIAAYYASQHPKSVVYVQLPCTDLDTE